MKREFLENLGLGEEAIDQIMDEHGKNINALKEKFSKLESQLAASEEKAEGLEEQVRERDNQLKSLSDQVKDHPELQKQIEDLKNQNEKMMKDYEEKLRDQSISSQIESALIRNQARNTATVLPLINREKLTLDDSGKLIGLDEQIEGIKKENDFLFGETKPVGTLPPDGISAGEKESSYPQKLAEAVNQSLNGLLNFD